MRAPKIEYCSWLLLFVAFVIGLRFMYWGEFSDEAETIVIADTIARGNVLYRDVFSHHFPFSYYWVALFTGLFGKSIFVVRLSVLLFQLLAFIIAMKLSRYYLAVAITAVFWSIVKYFYLGHMAIYSSFAGVSLLTVLIITLSILQKDITPNRNHWLAISIFSAIAFLSDPLCLYAIIVALTFIYLAKLSNGLKVSIIIGGFLILYTGYLLITHSLQAFWADAIVFNLSVYSKYVDTNPNRLLDLWRMIIGGLEIIHANLFNVDALRPMTVGHEQFDQWIFTGFLYRFSIIATAIFLLVRKQFISAAFFYVFAAATLLTNEPAIHAQPFMIVAIFAMAATITGTFFGGFNQYKKYAQTTVRMIVTFMTLWLMLRVGSYLYPEQHKMTYQATFANFERDAAYLQKLSCDQPDTVLAIYPDPSYRTWFADMKPVSKYPFLWPWIADVGLTEVINKLKEPTILAIVVRQDYVVWDKYDTQDYLRPLDTLLTENYYAVSTKSSKIYISPELNERCSQQNSQKVN